MARIVAGTWGGRRIAAPAGDATRPTSDRAREGLFGTVSALMDITGARVLDLFAGSGAIALEALSRGAAEATLVESSRAAARVIAANVAALGAAAELVVAPARSFLDGPPTVFDLVVADPPYRVPDGEVADLLAALVRGWLAPGAIVVVERSRRAGAPAWPDGVAAVKERRYGEAVLWYGQRS